MTMPWQKVNVPCGIAKAGAGAQDLELASATTDLQPWTSVLGLSQDPDPDLDLELPRCH